MHITSVSEFTIWFFSHLGVEHIQLFYKMMQLKCEEMETTTMYHPVSNTLLSSMYVSLIED